MSETVRICKFCGYMKKCYSGKAICPGCIGRRRRPMYMGPVRKGDWFHGLGFVWEGPLDGQVMIRHEIPVTEHAARLRGVDPVDYKLVTETYLRSFEMRAPNEAGTLVFPEKKDAMDVPLHRIMR